MYPFPEVSFEPSSYYGTYPMRCSLWIHHLLKKNRKDTGCLSGLQIISSPFPMGLVVLLERDMIRSYPAQCQWKLKDSIPRDRFNSSLVSISVQSRLRFGDLAGPQLRLGALTLESVLKVEYGGSCDMVVYLALIADLSPCNILIHPTERATSQQLWNSTTRYS